MKKLCLILSLLFGLSTLFGVEKPIYVFDLNGVLFDTSKITVFQQLGIADSIAYTLQHRSSSYLKKRFFILLDKASGTQGNSYTAKDPDGSTMPALMIEWIQGSKTNKAILDQIKSSFRKHPEWFESKREQELITRLAYAIFDPNYFMQSRKLLTDLLPVILLLKKHGAKLYVLSNWDKESFILLKQEYKDLFDLFDGCFISGDYNCAKPEPNIYKLVSEKLGSTNIMFLDDQQENILAAKQAGWQTVQVTKKSSYFRSTIDLEPIWQSCLSFLKEHNATQIGSLEKNISQKLEQYATQEKIA